MRDFTTVFGVDRRHLEQLSVTWPTIVRHKRDIAESPIVVFYDKTDVKRKYVVDMIRSDKLVTVPWPPPGVTYEGDPDDKWTHPQRYKMLAGFVHVPALYVKTQYWLKIDTDVVAHPCCNWIRDDWFNNEQTRYGKIKPAIVCHRWTFTKPADQFLKLDKWVSDHRLLDAIFCDTRPISEVIGVPEEGAERIGHKRIISWCGFFSTDLSYLCHQLATMTHGDGKLPVPSQDGYMWYVAARLGLAIRRVNMKNRGWSQWLRESAIRKDAADSLREPGNS